MRYSAMSRDNVDPSSLMTSPEISLTLTSYTTAHGRLQPAIACLDDVLYVTAIMQIRKCHGKLQDQPRMHWTPPVAWAVYLHSCPSNLSESRPLLWQKTIWVAKRIDISITPAPVCCISNFWQCDELYQSNISSLSSSYFSVNVILRPVTVGWLLLHHCTQLEVTVISNSSNKYYQCTYYLIVQNDSFVPENVCKNLEHGSIMISWWTIYWSVCLLSSQVQTSMDISLYNKQLGWRSL